MKKKKHDNKLLNAIKFISLANSKTGKEVNTHCRLESHSAYTANGVVACWHETDLELDACPQTAPLLLALERCGDQFALTQAVSSLSVRSGDFQAFVPCCDATRLLAVNADARRMAVGDDLIAALRLVLPLVSEKAEYLLNSTVQVRAGSVLATNNAVLIEAWHGYDLPYMLLPKTAVQAIVKCGQELTSIGGSENSATFYFGNEAWIKTLLYKDEVPDVTGLINTQVELSPVPVGFFEAVKQVAPFSEDDRILVSGSQVSSHVDASKGGKTESIKGELTPRIYNYKHLKLVSPFAAKMDSHSSDKATFFYGDKVRAAVWHMNPPKCTCGKCDICIPF